ncbi:MAG TPA: hypothetical protein VFA46_08545 [Actinomycetes bacterium]|nr:hypothetical protein [Actinomycetes bacterium]
MPDHPVHPDHEELAAWQAGALAAPAHARIVAHLAGCADCAAVVSAVERGRAALASLEEPELPPGLHQRITAAIRRETTAPAPEREAPRTGDRVARVRRTRGWRGRVAALSAAAALVLLVAGLVPVLRHGSGDAGTRQTSGAATASRSEGAPSAAAADAAASGLPVFMAPAGYSGAALRAAVAGDQAVREAYARAAVAGAAASPSSGAAAAGRPSPKAAPGGTQPSERAFSKDAPRGGDQQACIARVRAQTSEQLRPAFLVQTIYQGRPATVLVTRSADAPGEAELWAFSRGDCSSAPFAHERVQVPSP